MPKEGPDLPLGKSDALTVLLGKNNTIYYYHGDWNDALKANKPFKQTFLQSMSWERCSAKNSSGLILTIQGRKKWLNAFN